MELYGIDVFVGDTSCCQNKANPVSHGIPPPPWISFPRIKYHMIVLEGISKIGYVMTSQITSQRQAQKLRHDVENYVMTSKLS